MPPLATTTSGPLDSPAMGSGAATLPFQFFLGARWAELGLRALGLAEGPVAARLDNAARSSMVIYTDKVKQ